MTRPDTSRGAVRIRRGRLCAAASALVVTLVAVLGGVGVLPTETAASAAAATTGPQAALTSLTFRQHDRTRGPAPAADSASAVEARQVRSSSALPSGTGTGRRVVFDMSAQRVWLVGANGAVRRTYLVSGSLTDNLHPGSYEVYSRSRWAIGIDDSGTMEYFVRFTRGEHAAIGFHSIPTKDGRPLQTRSALGTPQSHGCIRQARPDAKRLWAFAPVGTKVVVTA